MPCQVVHIRLTLACFEEMGREGMAERVAVDALGKPASFTLSLRWSSTRLIEAIRMMP